MKKWKKLLGLVLAGGLSIACPKDPENCGDGVDNDGNGQIDCNDAACTNVAVCNPTENCNVVGDEDNDGDADCADADCAADPDCVVLCGNGTIDAGEDCDGANLGGNDCTDAGNFDGGTLACDATCNFDTTLCTAPEVENCNVAGDEDNDGDSDCEDADCAADPDCIETNNCDDNIDNDLDGLLDCLDTVQCAADAACTETGAECQAPGVDVVDDDGDGLIGCLDADCAAEPVCAVLTCPDGVIGAGEECDGALFGNETCASQTANAQPLGNLACNAACQIDATGCTAVVCNNNGVVDGTEQCDDGNAVNDDGCDNCAFTPDFEQEVNNVTANVFTAIDVVPSGGDGIIKGFVNPVGDIDLFSFTLATSSEVIVETLDGPLGSNCVANEVDTEVDIFDANGAVLDNDDDGGAGFCSLATAIVAAGDFSVQVRASDLVGLIDTFDYTLKVTITPIVCGDGIVNGAELCDGANLDGQDCTTLGFQSGTLDCNAAGAANECTFDTTACVPFVTVPGTEPNDDTIPNTNGGNGNDFHNGFCDNGTTACNVANGAQNCVIGVDGIVTTTCTPHNDAAQVIANAFNISAGDVLISEALSPAGDEDTFAITNDTANNVQIIAETFGPGGLGTCVGVDSEINFRDAAGAELANDDESGINNCSLETFIINPGQTLFVHVIDFLDNTDVPSYFLQISYVDIICGDGVIASGEACDDGNTNNGEGCSDICAVEPGFVCSGAPSVCVPSCGDGIINGNDQCDGAALGGNDCTDLGLNNAADGTNLLACAVDCTFDGAACIPSTCGNAIVEIGEQCDDPADASCDPVTCLFVALAGTEPNDDTIPNTGGGNGNDFHNGFCDNGTTACNVANGAQNCVIGVDGIVTTTCTPHNDDAQVIANPINTGDGNILISEAFAVAGDEDTFAVTNTGAAIVKMTAETFGPGGPGTCVGIDTELNIRNAAGAELANDDDGGINACSLETFAINPGQTLFVHAIDFGDSDIVASYFTQLSFVDVICGDGAIEAGIETCDDGNTVLGDGCSDLCQVEDGSICAGAPSVCVPSCGDGIVNSNDQCDGVDLGGNDCTTINQGFGSGTLACNADCTFDTALCSLAVCGNGIVENPEQCDNPADLGCDPVTCLFIAAAEVEANDDTIPNTAGGNGNDFHNGFCDNGTTACNVANGAQNCVIGVNGIVTTTCTPHNDDAQVNADGPFAVGDGSILISAAFGIAGDEDTFAVFNDGTNLVRLTAETFGPGGPGTCVGIDTELNIRNAAGAELANDDDGGLDNCSLETFAINPGQTLFVHTIDFGDSDIVASYFTQLSFVDVICGDGAIEAGIETCDDGNTVLGDGCSDLCQVETGFVCTGNPSVCASVQTEAEANDTIATANPVIEGGVTGAIDVSGDVDFYSIALTAGQVITVDLGDAATAPGLCANFTTDSDIAILNSTDAENCANDAQCFEFDDDGGAGFCSLVTATIVADGTFFIRARSSVAFDANGVFGYTLTITVN
jgi:cysteine-rich repeat protein